MAYTTRRAAHKQIKSAEGNLETALNHLHNVKELYQEQHPDISTTIESVMLVVLQAQELTKQLRTIF